MPCICFCSRRVLPFYLLLDSIGSRRSKALGNGNGILFFVSNWCCFFLSCFGCCWLATQYNVIHGSTVNKGFYSLATFILSPFLLFSIPTRLFFVYTRVDWFIYFVYSLVASKLWTSLSNDVKENDAKDDKCIHIRRRTRGSEREREKRACIQVSTFSLRLFLCFNSLKVSVRIFQYFFIPWNVSYASVHNETKHKIFIKWRVLLFAKKIPIKCWLKKKFWINFTQEHLEFVYAFDCKLITKKKKNAIKVERNEWKVDEMKIMLWKTNGNERRKEKKRSIEEKKIIE